MPTSEAPPYRHEKPDFFSKTNIQNVTTITPTCSNFETAKNDDRCEISSLNCKISEMDETGSVKKEKPRTAGAMRGFLWPVSAEALTGTS